MSYQNMAPYGGPSRGLPKPTSSGTLSNMPEYEPNNAKRQKLQPSISPYVYGGAYYMQPNHGQVTPYYVQQPQQPMPTHGTFVSNQWKAQDYAHDRNVPSVPYKPVTSSRPSQYFEKEVVELGKRDTDSDSDHTQEDINILPGESAAPVAKEESVKVPGTSITLSTEADIMKWRDERRKMWLLKISNNKQKHMQDMGIKEDELKGQKSILVEGRKQKQFLQSIQNQVNRVNPRSNLNVRIVQREMAQENSQLLQFIKELGDANLFECELTQEEKDKLFGANDHYTNDRRVRANNNNTNRRSYTQTYRNSHHH